MCEPIYHWEIEWIPDDKKIESVSNHEFTGTTTEANAEAQRAHPGYHCERKS